MFSIFPLTVVFVIVVDSTGIFVPGFTSDGASEVAVTSIVISSSFPEGATLSVSLVPE